MSASNRPAATLSGHSNHIKAIYERMPLGLEEGAAVVGLVGAGASLFKACVQGLVLLSKAKSYPRDVSGVSLRIELELHHLYSWAVEVGLTASPPAFLIDSEHGLLACKVLKHLTELVSDLDKLRTVHDLHLQEESEQLLRLDDLDTSFGRLGIEVKDGGHHLFMKIFQQRESPWKRLKWVTFDEQKARGLVDSIRSFIHELQRMLDRTRQAKIMKAVDLISRNAVLHTSNEQDLNMIGLLDQPTQDFVGNRIAAAARFKKHALLLGIMDNGHSSVATRSRADSALGPPKRKPSFAPVIPNYSSSDLVQKRLHTSRLKLGEWTGRETRLLAHYDGRPVLLEFRSKSGVDRELERDRVCKVSLFLSDLHPSFHGISCHGYVYVKVFDQFAYVFDLDEVSSLTAAQSLYQTTSYKSLCQLLESTSPPALNLRLCFAITILETLLQLHTSGWLHKELRSDNMLFFRDCFKDDADFLSSEMRITGYAHARLDRPLDPTEPLQSELEADLYRHPACLRLPKVKFRRAFDMFGVGCVLIELGLWRSLTTLCRTSNNREIDGSKSLDYMKLRNVFLFPENDQGINVMSDDIVRRLEASVGRKYTEVVKTLLQSSSRNDDLLDIQIDCLEALRSIYAVL